MSLRWKRPSGEASMGKMRSSAIAPLWISAAASIFVTLIFLPVGFSMMGLIEEWDIYFLFQQYGTFYFADVSSPLATHRLRPLTVTPFAIGYLLGPNSFLSLNILQVAALILKVIGMTSIVSWVSANRLTAILCGFVFLTYPADTMQMTLRAVHINCAIALTYGGVAMVLDSTRRAYRPLRLAEASLAALFFLAGSLIYEAGLFLAPVPLVLWWARFGFREGRRALLRNVDVVIVFATAVCGAAGYALVVSMTGSNYQMEVTGDHMTILKDIVSRLPLLFEIGLYRLFVHGWYDGLRMLWLHPEFWPFLPAVLALIAVLVFLLPTKASLEADATDLSRARLLAARLAFAGLIAAILGYLPYLTSWPHLMTSQRTFLYAAGGATLVVAALLEVLRRITPMLSAIPIGVCLLAGLGSQWHQLWHYTGLSDRQRSILAGILEAAPDAAKPGSKRLLILDRAGSNVNTWMLRGFELRNALTLLYGAEVDPLVCSEVGMVFSSFLVQPSGKPATCRRTPSGWTVGIGLPAPLFIPSEDLSVLTIEPDGHVTGSERAALQSARDRGRWLHFLGCRSVQECFHPAESESTASYEYDFGAFWGLDDVPRGAGFRDVEWNLPSIDPISWSWINSPDANLWFRLKPQPGQYTLQVKVYAWITEEARQSLKIRLNGKDLDARWFNPLIFAAEFDASNFNAGLNQIEFGSRTNAEDGVSIAIDRVSIHPSGHP